MDENQKDQSIKLTCKKGERDYVFQVDPSAPLGEVHDVLYEMLNYTIEKMKEHSDSLKIAGESNGDKQ